MPPWNTYEEVVAYARKNPEKFTYACAGIGVTQHICMERIAMKEGIKWSTVVLPPKFKWAEASLLRVITIL
jgi:tripartite-type tricarboxylate transporter receptor subunit TctC